MIDKPIKEAFSKVKEDIKALESKFEEINAKLDQLIQKKEGIDSQNLKFKGIEPQNAPQIEISTGNEGVQSINHSTITQQSLTNQSLNTSIIRVEDKFKSLTNQEFHVFLALYNLEDQLGRGITYEDLASKLNLSPSCMRSYTSSLIKKGIPILKYKLNNRSNLLKINPHFRELNLKERLTRLYFGNDPNQTTLF